MCSRLLPVVMCFCLVACTMPSTSQTTPPPELSDPEMQTPGASSNTGNTGPTGASGPTVEPTALSFAFVGTTGVSGDTAEISFVCDAADCTVSCALDAGAATPCTSPWVITGLSEGTHAVTLSASAGGQNAQLSDSFDVQLPPVIVLANGPPAALSNAASTSIAFSCAGGVASGVRGYHFQRFHRCPGTHPLVSVWFSAFAA
jgi:hypothetical protein